MQKINSEQAMPGSAVSVGSLTVDFYYNQGRSYTDKGVCSGTNDLHVMVEERLFPRNFCNGHLRLEKIVGLVPRYISSPR